MKVKGCVVINSSTQHRLRKPCPSIIIIRDVVNVQQCIHAVADSHIYMGSHFQILNWAHAVIEVVKSCRLKRIGNLSRTGSKTTGTLIQDNLLPGKNLYLIATGTGLAPFLSIIRDPEIYEQYDRIVLTHGCRHVDELAYRELITEHLPAHEYLGADVRDKLIYYPTVTREAFRNNGRLTDLLRSGKLQADVGLGAIDPDMDRFMICGSPTMLKEICELLESRGLREARHGEAAHYVIERAFVES